MFRFFASVLCASIASLFACLAVAQQPMSSAVVQMRATDSDARWEDSIRAFESADQLHAPAKGGVLFVGSSSIRLWDGLEQRFNTVPGVLKRGFGGSTLSACTRYLQRLVVPYQPRLVIVYAGDNDLAEGRTPDQVAASFAKFVEGVRDKLPDTRIAYISIKPSPARLRLADQIRETNALIHDYVTHGNNLDYIDIYTPMLGANGAPRADLFRADMLHLNDDGYALWTQVILAHLQ